MPLPAMSSSIPPSSTSSLSSGSSTLSYSSTSVIPLSTSILSLSVFIHLCISLAVATIFRFLSHGKFSLVHAIFFGFSCSCSAFISFLSRFIFDACDTGSSESLRVFSRLLLSISERPFLFLLFVTPLLALLLRYAARFLQITSFDKEKNEFRLFPLLQTFELVCAGSLFRFFLDHQVIRHYPVRWSVGTIPHGVPASSSGIERSFSLIAWVIVMSIVVFLAQKGRRSTRTRGTFLTIVALLCLSSLAYIIFLAISHSLSPSNSLSFAVVELEILIFFGGCFFLPLVLCCLSMVDDFTDMFGDHLDSEDMELVPRTKRLRESSDVSEDLMSPGRRSSLALPPSDSRNDLESIGNSYLPVAGDTPTTTSSLDRNVGIQLTGRRALFRVSSYRSRSWDIGATPVVVQGLSNESPSVTVAGENIVIHTPVGSASPTFEQEPLPI